MIEAARLRQQACEQAGLSDFGPTDDHLAGLRVLLAALDDADAPRLCATDLRASTSRTS